MYLEDSKKNISDFFSDKSDYWVNLYENDDHPSSFMRYELISRKKTIFNLFDILITEKNRTVLDIGCGIGNYLEELYKKGHLINGIDISENMLRTSKERLKKYISVPPLCRTDIENLPFPDNKFDVVFCVGVLEYLESDEKALEQISRVLKPGGLLFLTLPNILSIRNFLDPYYLLNKGWKFLYKRVVRKKTKPRKDFKLKDIALNTEFTNRRYTLNQVDPIFNQNNLKVLKKLSVAFGPPRFWLKDYITLKTNITISDFLIRQSNRKSFSFLKKLANRWVICVRKED